MIKLKLDPRTNLYSYDYEANMNDSSKQVADISNITLYNEIIKLKRDLERLEGLQIGIEINIRSIQQDMINLIRTIEDLSLALIPKLNP